MLTRSRMNLQSRRLTVPQRLRLWWQMQAEVTELTRDRAHEGRVLAEAAVRLTPGPWMLTAAFRMQPRAPESDNDRARRSFPHD